MYLLAICFITNKLALNKNILSVLFCLSAGLFFFLMFQHLQAPAVDCEALMEMICGRCMTRAPFLQTYAAHFAVSPVKKESLCKEQTNADMMTEEKGKCSYGQQEETTAGAAGRTSSPDSVPAHSRVTECVLNELKAKDAASARAGAVFWPYFWRAKLCTCTDCKVGFSFQYEV
uniref:Uncharacterized protein n=1 Tax=Sinocyclocheilus rhinocerous TaxID=307959 RepID=A0A673GFL8_9TELE